MQYQRTKQVLSYDAVSESADDNDVTNSKPKNNSMVDFLQCSGLNSQLLQNGGTCNNNDTSDVRAKQSGNNNTFALLHIYTYPKQNLEEDSVFQQLFQTGLDSLSSWNHSPSPLPVSRCAKYFTFEVALSEDFANPRSLVCSIHQLARLRASPKPKQYFVI